MKQSLWLGLGLASAALCGVAGAQTAPVARIAPLSVEVDGSAILASVLVERISRGDTTAEAAWQSGELNETMLLFLLDQASGDRTGESLLDRAELNTAFVEILIQHLPEKVAAENVAKLGDGTRYRLADYWFKRGDARAEPLLKELAAEGEAQFTAQQSLPWFYELSATRMGESYESKKQLQQAMQVFSRIFEISKHPFFASNAQVHAAGLYLYLGDETKAHALYAKAIKASNPFSSGRALLEEAMFSYQNGDLDTAGTYSGRAAEQFHLASPLNPSGFEQQARQMLAYTAQWPQTPLTLLPQKLQFDLGAPQNSDAKVSQVIKVRTRVKVPLAVSCDAPQITARLETDGWITPQPNSFPLFAEQRIVIEVDAAKVTRSLDAHVTVVSPTLKEARVVVPVRINYRPIRANLSTVFFGFVGANEQREILLQFASTVPFQIESLETDAPDSLTVSGIKNSSALQQTVTVKLKNTKPEQILQGKIRVKTDLPAQEVIELPYYAYIQPAR